LLVTAGREDALSTPPPDRREPTEADAEKEQRAGPGNFGELACEARQPGRVNQESVDHHDVGSDVYRADRRENHLIRLVNGLRDCPVVVEGVYENHGGGGRTGAWWRKALATTHTEPFRDVDHGSEISQRADQSEAGVVNQLAAWQHSDCVKDGVELDRRHVDSGPGRREREARVSRAQDRGDRDVRGRDHGEVDGAPLIPESREGLVPDCATSDADVETQRIGHTEAAGREAVGGPGRTERQPGDQEDVAEHDEGMVHGDPA